MSQMRKKFSLGPQPSPGTPGIGELYPGSKVAVSSSHSEGTGTSSIGSSSGSSSSRGSSRNFDSSLPGGMHKYLSGANPPQQQRNAPVIHSLSNQRPSSSPSTAAGMMSMAGRGVAGFLERSMSFGALSHSNQGFKV